MQENERSRYEKVEEEEAVLRNLFPSPPSHYTKYTTHDLHLLELLRERAGGADLSTVKQFKLLSYQTDVPEWPLAQLEKPRVDWIVGTGIIRRALMGSALADKRGTTSLAELGGHQLYLADPSVDRRPALRSILRSMLQQTEWINVLVQNVMAAANDLPPV
ncbi:uncharacterized protein LAESUDRAFT_732889 [Laetiporus sulphureus 93-53]|uniref:Mediator of RNA polymerase II transcription subunit 7 n=1 Tax=Laetiporus sulphureus 93-53 TaxID=1314785 RepID=A0A165AW51_9APHY|nr:uncharacterized protein LAESUDRAFT_732889 [Laetiporus sulphureus 93-53]KZS99771.1 hypothetical protein LAESUDRAFT_732889 [Laetiporus sulphureus 93-53]